MSIRRAKKELRRAQKETKKVQQYGTQETYSPSNDMVESNRRIQYGKQPEFYGNDTEYIETEQQEKK